MLTREQLIERLGNAEDNSVERKSNGVNRQELRQTISAFANSMEIDHCGVLFIGVADDGTLVGVANPDDLQRTIGRVCRDECYPPVTTYDMAVLPNNGAPIVAVVVYGSPDRPHFTGPAYVRRGAESVASSRELFEELIASRNEKTAHILNMRGQVITVQSIGHRLGDRRPMADAHYRETHECSVEACDAQVVRLMSISTDRRLAEPLRAVDVFYDEERRRPMLIVGP
jgi:hypothetical protein